MQHRFEFQQKISHSRHTLIEMGMHAEQRSISPWDDEHIPEEIVSTRTDPGFCSLDSFSYIVAYSLLKTLNALGYDLVSGGTENYLSSLDQSEKQGYQWLQS